MVVSITCAIHRNRQIIGNDLTVTLIHCVKSLDDTAASIRDSHKRYFWNMQNMPYLVCDMCEVMLVTLTKARVGGWRYGYKSVSSPV